MKKIAVLAAVAVLFTSCVIRVNNGSNGKSVKCTGPVVTKVMEGLDGFNAITINGGADLEVIQADVCEVTVTANDDVFQHLDYKVEDGVLILETIDHVGIKAQTFDIFIKIPELTGVTVNGASDLDMKGGYSSDKGLDIVINGAGDIDITGITVPSLSIVLNGAGDIDIKDMDVETLSVGISGAGDVDLSGKATSANFNVSGAGDIDASNLETSSVTTHKAGFASIKLK
ncbi:MAG: DUF2807 domain-containing protein [Bacteroidales bacterium]|nr:DUF2807 domain-containing protein [Bacteroidales bacterium]